MPPKLSDVTHGPVKGLDPDMYKELEPQPSPEAIEAPQEPGGKPDGE